MSLREMMRWRRKVRTRTRKKKRAPFGLKDLVNNEGGRLASKSLTHEATTKWCRKRAPCSSGAIGIFAGIRYDSATFCATSPC